MLDIGEKKNSYVNTGDQQENQTKDETENKFDSFLGVGARLHSLKPNVDSADNTLNNDRKDFSKALLEVEGQQLDSGSS